MEIAYDPESFTMKDYFWPVSAFRQQQWVVSYRSRAAGTDPLLPLAISSMATETRIRVARKAIYQATESSK